MTGCRRWVVLCACAVVGNALPLNQTLTQFGRQNWQTENGLPQNTIHSILQTNDGFLWLGTEGGLVRFDGLRFTIFDAQSEPLLQSNNIQQLAQDGAGNLWFSTPEGVSIWRNGHPYSYTLKDGLPSGRNWSVTSDSSGEIFAASTESLVRFDGKRFVPATAPTPLLAAGVEGKIQVTLAAGEQTWIGTDQGLWVQPGLTRYTKQDGLPSDRISCLLEDHDGGLWVGTESGVSRIARGRVETFPANDVLAGDVINALFEDREGDIWVGGDASGLTVLRKQKFTTYSFREPSLSPQIRCVFGTPDGAIWIGTDGGGLRCYRGGHFSTITTINGLSSNVILSLGAEADGTLLAGTPDGLNRISKGTAASLQSAANGLAEDFVRSIFSDRDGSLWVGTRRGLSHVTAKSVVTYTQSDGLGSDTVGAVVRDSAGMLWVATLHGLSRLDGSRFRNFTGADGLSGNVITDLYNDGDGTLWIATQDGGLDRYCRGRFSRYGSSTTLPQTIFGVTQDGGKNFWLSAKSGIFRIDRAGVVAYGTGDGLKVSEGSGTGHPAVWRAKGGEIWFSPANGVAVVASPENSLNRVIPPVAIESVSVDDKAYLPSDLHEVPAGKSRISFEYAGLSFLAPQRVQFRYRLEGFDKDWIDGGTRRVAYYTNLPAREYRFRVIARNNDGFWNESGAAIRFRILPHFYQTWLFYLLVLCATGLAVYLIYLWRVRQVRSRFEAVLEERNRIAREIHDTLAQGFAGISVQLEVASRLFSTSVEEAREHLDQARILARSSLKEARQSIWELRSQEATSPNFAARLSKLAQQVTESSSIKVQLEVQGQHRPLRSDVEDELFRIGQEAVANAVRHSEGRQVRVNLTFDSRKLQMTIADDGIGFNGLVDSQGPEGHFGLKGMRERAERIHAKLAIESKAGSGTMVSVEVPVR